MSKDRIKLEFLELEKKYSDLILIQDNFKSIISGIFSFNFEFNGVEIKDSYEIEVTIFNDYPRSLPVVKETGGKIPSSGKNIFHCNPDKSLCLGAPIELKSAFYKDPNLLTFFDRLMAPYFYAFSFFSKKKFLPYGELSHGTEGILEYYLSLLKLDKEFLILDFLGFIINGKSYFGFCPCRSKKLVSNCHLPEIRFLSDFSDKHDYTEDYFDIYRYMSSKGYKSLESLKIIPKKLCLDLNKILWKKE